jgi:hypothetical protein
MTEFDAESEQGLGLGTGLDPLRQQTRLGLPGEVHHAGDKRLARLISIDPATTAIQLDETGPQLEDALQISAGRRRRLWRWRGRAVGIEMCLPAVPLPR